MKLLYLMFMLLTLLCGSPLFAQDSAENIESQTFIWYESRLGHVFVGPADQPGPDFLAYGYYFVAIGPKPSGATERYGDCLRDALELAAARYRDEVARNVENFADQPLYSGFQINRTRIAIVTARGIYRQTIPRRCAAAPQELRRYLDGTSLALVRRECAERACAKPALPVVTNDTSRGRLREKIFEATHYWVLASKLDLGRDRVIKMGQSANGGLDASTVEVTPAADWLAPISAQQRFALFAKRARRIYTSPSTLQMSATVAAQIDLPKDNVLRIAGAFDDPANAYEFAKDVPEMELSNLQDEVARIRIRECHDFRGKPDLSSVAQCAGYELTQEQMLGCLGLTNCLPAFSGQVHAGTMLLSARRSFKELVEDSILPRPFSDLPGGFKKLADDVRACTSPMAITAQPSTIQIKQIQRCMGEKTIPDAIAGRANCLLTSTSSSRLSCLLSGEDRQRAEALQTCLESRASNCIVQAALPAKFACIGRAQSVADLACAEPLADVAAAAACINSHSDASDYVEKIRCIAGDQVAGPAGDLLDCYGSSASREQFAICTVGRSLPPEQALLVKCATESGGNYLSAGLCMAAPHLGLSPGEQIILQCAVSTGGEPISFATCTVGQFTFRELMGCRNADFGQPGCFGEGNEIQKLAKALTGSTISSESVVGQVTVFHINHANAAVSGVGQVLSQVGEGAGNLKAGFAHEVEKVQTNPIRTLLDTPGNIVREGSKALEDIGREVGKGICNALGC